MTAAPNALNALSTVSTDAALAAAAVLAEALPTAARLSARISGSSTPADVAPDLARTSVVCTFVGARSYDIALALAPGLLPDAPLGATGTPGAPGAPAPQTPLTTELLRASGPDARNNSVVSGGAGGPAVLPLEQLVETALADASSRFGQGVLGELRVDDASALFADPLTTVVELRTDDAIVGLFAARARAAATRIPLGGDVSTKLGRISGVEMALTVQIGRTRMSVHEVLSLEAGAIVELDRSAGAPADILLNGRMIAQGEVVVVDQDYAVRITRILDASDTAA